MHDSFKLGTDDEYRYAYELDFSGSDSSQSKIHYELEQSWYKEVYKMWKEAILNEEKTKNDSIFQHDEVTLEELWNTFVNLFVS